MSSIRPRVLAVAVLVVAGACGGPIETAAPSPAAGNAPLGSWTVTITAEDFRQAGLTNEGGTDENSGTFTFTVNSDGTYTEAQEADQPVRWPVFRGTWTETLPGTLELRTTFPPDFVGEVVVIGWARDGDDLRLRLVSPNEPFLKVHFETHPWSPAT